jgi:hypothetical protein
MTVPETLLLALGQIDPMSWFVLSRIHLSQPKNSEDNTIYRYQTI